MSFRVSGCVAAGLWIAVGSAAAAPLSYRTQLHMTSATHGYALHSSQGRGGLPDAILETKDSGAHWTPIPAKSGKMAALLKDGTPAWYGIPQDVCPAGLDKVPDDQRPLWAFVDAKHAWFATCGDTSEDREIRGIFKTDDAGQHWVRVSLTNVKDTPGSLPIVGHKAGLFFLDPARGWIFGSDDSGAVDLFATTDGGKTWKRQQLSVPPNAWVGLRGAQPDTLHFLGSRDAYLRVDIQLNNEEPAPTLYATSDAGQHWKVVGPAPGPHLSFPDLKHGFSAWGERLWNTKDGGKHWTQVSLGLGKIDEIQFINAETGWVWTCGSSLDERCQLLATQDGGRRWFVQDPQEADPQARPE